MPRPPLQALSESIATPGGISTSVTAEARATFEGLALSPPRRGLADIDVAVRNYSDALADDGVHIIIHIARGLEQERARDRFAVDHLFAVVDGLLAALTAAVAMAREAGILPPAQAAS